MTQTSRVGASAALLLLLAAGLAGCLDQATDPDATAGASATDFVMQGEWSTPRQPALFDKLPSVKTFVAVRDGTEMSIGLFLPDIEGCDWDVAELPEACHLPVVMDAGPYYTDRIDIDKGRPQWVEWLVPRGYAVVQMALRGTGESGGCMGFKAPGDVEDISDVVDWVADQPWSNGNVGVAGRSYDGTAAWSAAASGNPHVKTIMPISGAVDAPHLYFKNGTTEVRALIPHLATYWALYAVGLAGDDPTHRGTDVAANVCPEAAQPHVEGPLAAFTGDASSDYWQSRDLTDRILEDYGGSAWIIHGMVDWNVNPSQAVPFVNEMIDAGIPTRAWLGQWGHAYPDHMPEHINVRWDWADQIVAWFDHYLREEGDTPWLGVEVEDDAWRWRTEAHYPPRGAEWAEYSASLDTGLVPTGRVGAMWQAEHDGIIAGLPQVDVAVTPTTATGGSLFAEVWITHDGEPRRVGWGALNLMNRAGGNTDPQPLVPGQQVTVEIQFEPTDAPLYAGDTIEVRLDRDGVQDIAPSFDQSPLLIGDVTVRLPLVAEPDAFIDIPLTDDDPRAP